MPDQKFFLNVKSSASEKAWVERLDQTSRNTALEIAQTHDIPELVSRVLAGRGVVAKAALSFLDPTIRDLMPDPSVMTDMEKAANRIADAIRQRDRVAIFGDYDVDGAASSALLSKFLAHYEVPHEIYIPDRIFEGYGPNIPAIEQLVEAGAKLIVTVDCGATSFDALERANELGVDVVVLDHHQMGEELPIAVAVVNPNRQDDLSDLGFLCAGGVVFMALVATQRALRNAPSSVEVDPPNLLQWLDLVALATVCDVVPLKALNRAFVVKGLATMRQRLNVGLNALGAAARLDGPPNTYHLGFLLGPRINAGGRIGDASLGARLLTSQDEAEAIEIAATLERLNGERQAAEAQMLEEAIAEADAEIGEGEGPAVLVTENENWHPGIVGLLASRLKDRYTRPAFAIAFDRKGKGSGSGRSIAGVDLGAAVREAVAQQILEKGGGHAMAAGLTIGRDKLADFRAFLEKRLAEDVADLRRKQVLKIDGALTARSATLDLFSLIEKAGPYGPFHPQPVFAFPSHTVRYAKIVGANHVSVTLGASDGATLRAIAFRAAETPLGDLLLGEQGPIHVAGTLSADFWQGQRRIQLRITDAALPPRF